MPTEPEMRRMIARDYIDSLNADERAAFIAGEAASAAGESHPPAQREPKRRTRAESIAAGRAEAARRFGSR